MYLLHREEIESLAKNIPGVKRIRFFMTFGQSYLDHMRCLEDVGMLSTKPINYEGQRDCSDSVPSRHYCLTLQALRYVQRVRPTLAVSSLVRRMERTRLISV